MEIEITYGGCLYGTRSCGSDIGGFLAAVHARIGIAPSACNIQERL